MESKGKRDEDRLYDTHRGKELKVDPYRIVLADDHAIVRQGIRKMIEERADLEVVAEVGDGLELLRLLEGLTAHLVLLDISMPNLRGIEAARELKRLRPDLKVLILTMHKDKELLYHAVSAGADGFMVKEDSGRELFSAIDKIQKGDVYISPSLSEELIGDWVKASHGDFKPPGERLTTREREILKLIAEGRSNREIAALLFISVRTVESHRASIRNKLGLKKTADLTKYAIRRRYTLPSG